jgi:F-type H+-transporting ATPase subunit c|tara:strand:- start:98 stop:427 length:330 start_codon:yes stop_codon:yes gene_type:complete
MTRLLAFLVSAALMFLSSGMAMAAVAGPAGQADSTAKVAIALASGFAIAIAAFGAALGQGRMAAAAMESIGRNPNAAPSIQLPMILGLAFIEALAIYALIIAFTLAGKL